MEVKQSQLSDLDGLAFCHKRAFPKSLSSLQGHRFVKKMLEWYIAHERGVMIHIEVEGHIMGYCGGIITKLPGLEGAVTSINTFAFNDFVISYMRRPWLVFHPLTIRKAKYILRSISVKLGVRNKKTSPTLKNGGFRSFAGVVVIGVDPDFQGKGGGSMLLEEFERIGREEGVEVLRLSVNPANAKAIGAYKKNQWKEEYKDSTSMSMTKEL